VGSPPRVLLACSGLDHVRRGFESFARECFTALAGEQSVSLELIKGTGASGDRERAVSTMTRDSRLARALGGLTGREPFRFEQIAFAFSLQPELHRRKPDVVYFSEWHTGLVLAQLRRLSGASYRLVLCNGTMAHEGFEHLDQVQQLTPVALKMALQRENRPSRHTLLPLGVSIDPQLTELGGEDRRALRARLGLPSDRPILLSVAALNRYHKRIDYLIEEVSRLAQPRPFLLLAGQSEAETPQLRSLAARCLGTDGHSFRSVPHAQIGDLYRASDAFALASLGESFGLVLVEAMSHGLPCYAHDYEITRFVLGEHGRLGDLSRPGALARLLSDSEVDRHDPPAEAARHEFAYDSFSWDRLRPRYVELLRQAANRTVSSSTDEKLSNQNR
jgi:1,2-diacylglycerol 3-alpha-glucosyltransferase